MEYSFDVDDYQGTDGAIGWGGYLEREGFVVLRNVLDEPETQKGIEVFMDWMEHISPGFSRDDAATYDNRHWPYHFARGIVMEGSPQHSPFMWYSRTQPGVLDVFHQLYGENQQLLVSFDRCNVIWGGEDAMPSSEAWWHIDYPGPQKDSWYCYQSFINYVDCTSEGSPCLRVIRKSHKLLPEMLRRKMKMVDLVQLAVPDEDIVSVRAPAGSLVLWKCGVIHDNHTAVTDVMPDVCKYPLRRLVSYVNYAPRCFSTDQELEEREVLFLANLSSGHWPISKLYPIKTKSKPHQRRMQGLNVLQEWKLDVKDLMEQYPQLEQLVPLSSPSHV